MYYSSDETRQVVSFRRQDSLGQGCLEDEKHIAYSRPVGFWKSRAETPFDFRPWGSNLSHTRGIENLLARGQKVENAPTLSLGSSCYTGEYSPLKDSFLSKSRKKGSKRGQKGPKSTKTPVPWNEKILAFFWQKT
jgi:hypothetical protein